MCWLCLLGADSRGIIHATHWANLKKLYRHDNRGNTRGPLGDSLKILYLPANPRITAEGQHGTQMHVVEHGEVFGYLGFAEYGDRRTHATEIPNRQSTTEIDKIENRQNRFGFGIPDAQLAEYAHVRAHPQIMTQRHAGTELEDVQRRQTRG